jgi:hypothetical protein
MLAEKRDEIAKVCGILGMNIIPDSLLCKLVWWFRKFSPAFSKGRIRAQKLEPNRLKIIGSCESEVRSKGAAGCNELRIRSSSTHD